MGNYTYNNPNQIGLKDASESVGSLADFLKQKQQFQQSQQQPFELAKQKSQLSEAAQERESQQAQDIADKYRKAGSKVNVKIGDTSLGETEENPLKYMFMNQGKTAKALSDASHIYLKSVPDIQKRAQAAQEGLESVNDPNQISSVGQARTLMIKNLGMNRYNSQEGNALVPNQFSQVIDEIFNKMGADNNPLTESQRAALNSTFINSLQSAKKQHQIAKQNATGSFRASPYYDVGAEKQMMDNMGTELDKQINDAQEKYHQVPKNVGYQPPTPGSLPVSKPGLLQRGIDTLQGLVPSNRSQTSPTQPPETPEQEYLRLKQKYNR